MQTEIYRLVFYIQRAGTLTHNLYSIIEPMDTLLFRILYDGQRNLHSICIRNSTGVVSMHIEYSEQQTFPYVFDHKTFPNTYTSGTAEA